MMRPTKRMNSPDPSTNPLCDATASLPSSAGSRIALRDKPAVAHAADCISYLFSMLAFTGLMLSFAAAHARAEDQLVYVKKESRRSTRDASLDASGLAKLPSDWQLIGPFDNADNSGFDKVYPPEEKIDLTAEYPAVKGNAKWRKMSFGDGRVHSLRRFDADGPLVCYLYRQINSPEAKNMRVSLGSDDGIKVWLNGELLFSNDVKRGATAGQDYVTLPLREGNNDLLLKVVNREGRTWGFYFAPTLPERLLVALDRQLDRDFPTSDAASYRIESLPLPENEMIEVGGLAFRPDGKLYVATRRGDVWLVTNPLSDDVRRDHDAPLRDRFARSAGPARLSATICISCSGPKSRCFAIPMAMTRPTSISRSAIRLASRAIITNTSTDQRVTTKEIFFSRSIWASAAGIGPRFLIAAARLKIDPSRSDHPLGLRLAQSQRRELQPRWPALLHR